ncbi:hypothetical protein ED733_000329 [Metarhizium rileyi]|uniref:Tautomerase cis-CaaD-like domain-containing protein n=1 Tax=Metarhizium rileyi (strain RCEF 4871) TaxID=1649241 RepID=A0A5C6GER3_METRR|nr:hypothetical protein ED733_000329 [Metarhizium rileyi]
MASVPPTSAAAEAPPSYEEVVKKFNGLIGSNPNPRGVLDAADGLSQTDLDVLVANHDQNFPIKTEQQKVSFATGVAKTSCSAELQDFVNVSASAAATTAVEITRTFHRVQSQLAKVDQRSGTSFQSQFLPMKAKFQSALDDSREVASRIAGSITVFDGTEIAYAHDDRASIEGRVKKIEKYITSAAGLQTESSRVQSEIAQVKTSLSDFIVVFTAWAKDKEGELSEAIRRIKADLLQLENRLADRETKLQAVTHFTQGLAPITSALALAFPPYSSAIAIGGLIFGGMSLATTTALVREIGMLKHAIAQKTKEKEDLGAELEAIRQAREELEETGTASLSLFGDCIKTMPGVSTAAVGDASKILEWLKAGAPAQSRTLYAQLNRDDEVRSSETTSSKHKLPFPAHCKPVRNSTIDRFRMPLYEVRHSYALTDVQREELAGAITQLHATKFATPSVFVHVRFILEDLSGGHYFMAGKRRYNNSNGITAYVRTSPARTKADFDQLAQHIEEAWYRVIGARPAEDGKLFPPDTEESRLTAVAFFPILAARELGLTIPEAGKETEWFKEQLPIIVKTAESDGGDLADMLNEFKEREDLRKLLT